MAVSSDDDKRGALIRALELTDPKKDYYPALGKFIDAFARMEQSVYGLLMHYSKVSPKIGKVLFSGTRIDLSIENIKRIAKINRTSPQRMERLNHFCSQISVISKLRNDIVHIGAMAGRNNMLIVSNANKVNRRNQIRRTVVSAHILEGMTQDLRIIELHIVIHLRRRRLAPDLKKDVDALLQEPWLYTPRQPRKKRRKTLKTRRTPPLQHQSSPP